MCYIIRNLLNLLSGKGDRLKGSDICLLGEAPPIKSKFDKDKYQQDFDSKNYPESDKYFEIAKQLLQKYPAEQWSIESRSDLIKHSQCPISFAIFVGIETYVSFSDNFMYGKLKRDHKKELAEMFSTPIKRSIAEWKEKCKKKQEENQIQFNAKLAAALH